MQVERNVIFNKAGGNASKNAVTYKINIPADMIRELGVTDDDRSVTLTCKNGIVTIKKPRSNSPGVIFHTISPLLLKVYVFPEISIDSSFAIFPSSFR